MTNNNSKQVSTAGYLLSQCALLITYYGLGYIMPWWVVWFPSLLIGLLVLLFIVLFLVALLFGETKKKSEYKKKLNDILDQVKEEYNGD